MSKKLKKLKFSINLPRKLVRLLMMYSAAESVRLGVEVSRCRVIEQAVIEFLERKGMLV